MIDPQDWLAHRARSTPDKLAVIYRRQKISFHKLNLMVAELACQLHAASVLPGDHVAVLLHNRLEFICLIHALARLSAVIVPLNVRLTKDELEWQIKQANASFLICSQETEDTFTTVDNPRLQIISVDEPINAGVTSLNRFPVRDADKWLSKPLNTNNLQSIVFTSGTTGQPKGAMLTFANHLWSAAASASRLGLDPEDRWLICMPLFHVGGMSIVLRSCLYGTSIVLQTGFKPLAVKRAITDQGITLVSLVPTMLQRILDTGKNKFLQANLRLVLLGGAATPMPLLEQCASLSIPVVTTYGLTEACSQLATSTVNGVRRKPGCVGKPLMFTDIKIINDVGEYLPPGEIGEIVAFGPNIMKGYYKQYEHTKEILQNGKLHTGDMGYLDEDGDLWVIQRRNDLIVSGGENIYPSEVERVLLSHPSIHGACVVGLEDEEWGQRVATAIVTMPGVKLQESDVINFCRESLAGYKIPKIIKFLNVLPTTASGKIGREAVRTEIYKLIEQEKKNARKAPKLRAPRP